MARPCTICNHPDRVAIDAALRIGDSFGAVAARFGVSKTGVYRHAQAHVESALVAGTRAEATPFRNDGRSQDVTTRSGTPPRRGRKLGPLPRPPAKPKPRKKAPPRPGQKKYQTGPEVVETALKEASVFKMRLAGASVTAIANEHGIAESTMREFIDRAIRRRVQENSDSIHLHRQLELERVDAVQAAIWDIALKAPEMEIEGVGMGKDYAIQLKAVERFTKLSEHRAKLLGIYAPAKHQHAVAVAVKTLGLPTDLEAVMVKARAGDAEARRRLEAYVKTKRLPSPEELDTTVVEATAEPAASG